MQLLKGKGHGNRGIAADIPKNKPFRDAVIERKWHENTGMAAGIP